MEIAILIQGIKLIRTYYRKQPKSKKFLLKFEFEKEEKKKTG